MRLNSTPSSQAIPIDLCATLRKRKSVESAISKFKQTEIQAEEEKTRLDAVGLKGRRSAEQTDHLRIQIERFRKRSRRSEEGAIHKRSSAVPEEARGDRIIFDISGITAQDKNMKANISSLDEKVLGSPVIGANDPPRC